MCPDTCPEPSRASLLASDLGSLGPEPLCSPQAPTTEEAVFLELPYLFGDSDRDSGTLGSAWPSGLLCVAVSSSERSPWAGLVPARPETGSWTARPPQA